MQFQFGWAKGLSNDLRCHVMRAVRISPPQLWLLQLLLALETPLYSHCGVTLWLPAFFFSFTMCIWWTPLTSLHVFENRLRVPCVDTRPLKMCFLKMISHSSSLCFCLMWFPPSAQCDCVTAGSSVTSFVRPAVQSSWRHLLLGAFFFFDSGSSSVRDAPPQPLVGSFHSTSMSVLTLSLLHAHTID